MSIQMNTRERIGSFGKTKALAAGLLMAGMMAMGLMAAAPAHAATTFTVNDTRDSPDASSTAGGTCDIDVFNVGNQCTLRAAIQQANATVGADTINFNIPDLPAPGVATIHVNSGGFGALPQVIDPVTIDGYTQPGASPNTLAQGTNAVLKIELNGTNAGARSGLLISGAFGSDPSGSVVRGLVINRFARSGIEVDFDDPLGSNGIDIQGNFIGTDPSGTIDRGNGTGLFIQSQDSLNHIGGNSGARNLISGNDGDGVRITVPTGGATGKYSLSGNLIGTKKDGTGALGNSGSGVSISGSSGNNVQSNTLAFNGRSGVAIEPANGDFNNANGNIIALNSIFSNTGLGIDLNNDGPTPNDTGDADQGANTLQNKPVLASAKNSSTTTITGKLNSNPNKTFKVEFYSNPSGNEGKKFIGEKFVTTNGSGNASFAFSPASKVAVGQTITATATNNNNTSEFSAARTVASS